jgi:hypothetical protein
MSLLPTNTLARLSLQAALLCMAMFGRGIAQESPQEHQAHLKASVAAIDKMINVLRPALFDNLTGSEAKTYKQIAFHVSNEEVLSEAGSWVDDDGKRTVEIAEGYGRQIQMMAEAELIEDQLKKPVLIPYIQYVVDSWRQHATFIKEPSAFADFDFDSFLAKPEGSLAWNKMSSNALAFVLAHEVGHHVLGHCDKPTQDATVKRQRELDADSWAIKRLEKANPHFSPTSGVIPLIFNYYIAPNPIANEARSDHPAELRRIHEMFEAMEELLPQYRVDIEKEGFTYAAYSSFVKKSLADYELQMAIDPADQEAIQACVDKERNYWLRQCHAGSERCNEILSRHEAEWRKLCTNQIERQLHKQ